MPSMSADKIEFEWGKTRGKGGSKKDVQFYESFRYDGLNYSLYDSVYLFKDGVAEPYIGKIIKIWEHASKARKVKILWFFRPSEISSYTGGLQILKNELFLGTGAGSGLDNVNSLEAIAGKCNVVCISTDKRNRQPLPEELSMADFVFFRTFDVDKLTVSDKLGESISNVKVELLLNNENPQILNPLRIKSNDAVAAPEVEQKKDTCKILVLTPASVPLEPAHEVEKDNVCDTKMVGLKCTTASKDKIQEKNEENTASKDKIEETNAAALRDPQLKKDNVCDTKMVGLKRTTASKDKIQEKNEENTASKDKVEEKNEENAALRDDNLKNSLSSSRVDDDNRSLDERPFKKHKADESIRSPSMLPVSAFNGNLKMKRPVSELLNDRQNKLLKPAEAVGTKTNAPSKPVISKKDNRVYGQVLVVSQRPDADSSKWFTGLPWEDTMKGAQEDGTLVLLQNLDPTYTSSEIEDIVWHSFRENCTAKVLFSAAVSSPHSIGQAFVIFRTKQAAVNVVRKLEEGCLMLPNGRPLLGHVAGRLPGKSSSFPGHLHIDRLKFSMQKDKRDAISTSHSSQPNTLEYDMAMDWRLLQERSELMRKNLLKKQGEEVRKLKGNLKRKF